MAQVGSEPMHSRSRESICYQQSREPCMQSTI